MGEESAGVIEKIEIRKAGDILAGNHGFENSFLGPNRKKQFAFLHSQFEECPELSQRQLVAKTFIEPREGSDLLKWKE